MRHYFVREKVVFEEIIVEHVTTQNNLTDALTKKLLRSRFQELICKMGMRIALEERIKEI